MSRRELGHDPYTASLLTNCMAIVLAAGRIIHKTCEAMDTWDHLWLMKIIMATVRSCVGNCGEPLSAGRGNLRVRMEENAGVQAPYLSPGFGDFRDGDVMDAGGGPA